MPLEETGNFVRSNPKYHGFEEVRKNGLLEIAIQLGICAG